MIGMPSIYVQDESGRPRFLHTTNLHQQREDRRTAWTRPGWIEKRTGILSWPIADDDLVTSDLVIDSGGRALGAAGVQPDDVGRLFLGRILGRVDGSC
jgi:3-oxoacyl-[acyl-carrier-protein] synthase III